MKVNSPGTSVPVSPDPYTLCQAIDLMDESQAIGVFLSGVITRASSSDVQGGGLQEDEQHGFYLVMGHMLDRIKKASSIVDEYREGVSHD